jgi:hypothetical protein
MTMHATIWRADSPLARCSSCGSQQQFHGRPNHCCASFVAETAADLEPADLATLDLIRECDAVAMRYERQRGTSDAALLESDRLHERIEACRSELDARVRNAFGVCFDDLRQTMGW